MGLQEKTNLNKTSDQDNGSQPLKGLTVLDLGQIYNGPYCGLLMGFLGARVIKVESPTGDLVRQRDPYGEPYPYLWLNSNKESIMLDLKSSEGRSLFERLVKVADILVENFNVGVMDRLGLGWEHLQQINPRLIYASGKGFGLTGPYANRSAMDLTVQAMSGALHSTGYPDQLPVKAGPAISDFLGGVHLCLAAVSAVLARQKTGKGQFVEAAMHDAVIYSLTSAFGAYFDRDPTRKVPPRTGNRHPGLAMAPYNVYRASDGLIAIFCVAERHWNKLIETMQISNLRDHSAYNSTVKRAQKMEEIDEIVERWTSARTKKNLQDILDNAGVPCAIVYSVEEVSNDPHLKERGMLIDCEHPRKGSVRLPTSPVRLHGGVSRGIERLAPLLGQDTDFVLRDLLSLKNDELNELRRRGVICKNGRHFMD